MGDLISIIELFKGTIFYLLVGLATLFTIFGFGVFIRNRMEIKKKSQSFKNGILHDFLKRKKTEIETEMDNAWRKFFDEIDDLRKSEKEQDTVKTVREKVEEFSEDFQLFNDKNDIIGEFATRMKKIYRTWRALFKNTFLFFFIFITYSGVTIFIMSFPLANYIGYWTEYLGIILLVIGLILFIVWARYFFASIKYHYYGEIDDFLLVQSAEVENRLDEYFDMFVKRWRRTQIIFKGFLGEIVRKYPTLNSTVEIIQTLRKTVRALKK